MAFHSPGRIQRVFAISSGFQRPFLLSYPPYDLEPEPAASTASATVPAVLQSPTHAPSQITKLDLSPASTISAQPQHNFSSIYYPRFQRCRNTQRHRAAVAQSARRATVVERVASKVPTYKYYGFVLYLTSSLAFRAWLPSLFNGL
jgi:hypothetical protein